MTQQYHDSPKPRKKRSPIMDRLAHLESTIPGLLIIGAAVIVSRIEMDETVKTAIGLPLIAIALGMLGYKGKK
jgi:hypothetical protein